MSEVPKKRGALSTEEMKFIEDNFGKMSIQEIAAEINRNDEPVHKYAIKQNLVHDNMPVEKYDEVLLKKKLKSRPYWDELVKQFTKEKLDFFVVSWVEIMKQLNQDVLYTEETQIKNLITLEILANQILEDRKYTEDELDRLKVKLDEELSMGDDCMDEELVADLQQEIAALRASKNHYTKEHMDILNRNEKTLKELKAARSDRFAKADNMKTSWTNLMQALEEEPIRRKEGQEAEIMRMAMYKAQLELAKFHTYEDGLIDQPLLNSKTAIEDD